MDRLTIYEAHVKDFTLKAPFVPAEHRGKFAGLPYTIPHLKRLGVNAIQLMPIFNSEGTHWNYDPVSWFNVNPNYGTLDEFKAALKAFHDAGIKVILDVVYNHTHGKMDGVRYYDWDVTGCGNTVDVKKSLPVITRSINYWLRNVKVDGLRFDLANVLGREGGEFTAQAKFFKEMEQYKDKILIAEPWDCAAYSVGRFPRHWLELNDKIRDAVRRGGTYFCGDNYKRFVGFATSHDGFTLQDLVSYNYKHNERNGENNRDGCNANHSNNHGVEGPTDNPWIIKAREETKKAMMRNLKISAYHILILMGDEMCRTQDGNNNDYLYGTPLDWGLLEKHKDWFNLYRKIIKQ